MKLRTSKLALLAVCATMAVVAVPLTNGVTAAPSGNIDGTIAASIDSSSALVVLTGDPVATAKNVTRGNGSRVNLNSAATKSYRAKLSAQRNAFRKWLQINAPAAQITGQFDIALNAVAVNLNGTSLDTIRRSTQVVSAQFEGLYYPTNTDPDLALINAVSAWGAQGAQGAGAGVKVAIIDSGIEATHTCFDDMGDTTSNPLTNNKVIVAKVFYNKAKVSGLTAAAVGTHGTHVAGTVACDYGTHAVVDGVAIPHTISGVAPAALLGNYNVFPGNVENARSEDILNALEAAFSDGMDVANMSLGGDAHGAQDLLTVAVDNLDFAGMVVAVSAGNSGPGFGTLGSPGSAERALTAGAATVSHIVTRTITFTRGSAYATPGEFGAITTASLGTLAFIDGIGPVDIPALAGLSTACTPGDVEQAPGPGYVAAVARGECTFTDKVHSVMDKGYEAVIVVNREEATLAMAGDGTGIPALLVPVSARVGLEAADGTAVSVTDPQYIKSYALALAGEMADFSSEGPSDVDRRVKPDLVAPGVNVLSSVVGGGFAFFNGTSMASPHLAGAAAVVRARHPAWEPWQVRSAITNTANINGATPFFDNPARDPNLIGAGLLDLSKAVNATLLLSSPSISFGTTTSGSGKTNVKSITFNSTPTVSAAVVDGYGSATFTAAISGNTLTVTQSSPKGAAAGSSWATVNLFVGADVVAHLRVYVLVA